MMLRTQPSPTHFPYTTLFRSTSEARLAAEQGEPFPSPVQALRGHLPAPGDGIDLPGEVADLVLHQGVGDGAISDASRPSPGSVGPCSDLQALLAQDAEDRLDCVTLGDRKSTRLNSSHVAISYAVFCLKKKTDK